LQKVTREMVLQGYGYEVHVSASEYGDGSVFIVASPTASEVSEAKALRMRLSEVKGETDPAKIDLGKALIAEEETRRFLIARALTRGMAEEWTSEDVGKIRPAVIARLWKTVDQMIGFTAEAEESVRNFPKVQKDKS